MHLAAHRAGDSLDGQRRPRHEWVAVLPLHRRDQLARYVAQTWVALGVAGRGLKRRSHSLTLTDAHGLRRTCTVHAVAPPTPPFHSAHAAHPFSRSMHPTNQRRQQARGVWQGGQRHGRRKSHREGWLPVWHHQQTSDGCELRSDLSGGARLGPNPSPAVCTTGTRAVTSLAPKPLHGLHGARCAPGGSSQYRDAWQSAPSLRPRSTRKLERTPSPLAAEPRLGHPTPIFKRKHTGVGFPGVQSAKKEEPTRTKHEGALGVEC